MDVYLDGKLINSFILPNIYKQAESELRNIYLGKATNSVNSFQGFITRVRYQPFATNPKEAYKIYKDGINMGIWSSLLGKYNLNVEFKEYDRVISGFNI